MFVFLADIIFFGEVDQVNDWFCSQEEERVDNFDLENQRRLQQNRKHRRLEVRMLISHSSIPS